MRHGFPVKQRNHDGLAESVTVAAKRRGEPGFGHLQSLAMTRASLIVLEDMAGSP
jgi:hypothetical protein